jgi:2-oxoglutarate ferredoxin oxidoreductase subunit gamma
VLERAVIAGFGGQGILFLGKLLAESMMHEGREVTYFPAYGPEVRGGRANCHVIVSSEPIYSPFIPEPDTLIALNQPSWDYYIGQVRRGGLAVANASMVCVDACPEGVRVIKVAATDIAKELGDVRVANMVMLGAYNAVRKLLPVDALFAYLRGLLGEAKAKLYDVNRAALEKGHEAAAEQDDA